MECICGVFLAIGEQFRKGPQRSLLALWAAAPDRDKHVSTKRAYNNHVKTGCKSCCSPANIQLNLV
jgi:hypothetical protein